MLVNRLPGPITTRSASSIADRISCETGGGAGRSVRLVIASCSSRCAARPSISSRRHAGRRGRRAGRGRDHDSLDPEDRSRALDRLSEVAGELRQHREEQVAERVPAQERVVEAIAEEVGEERLGGRQGHEAVPDVPWRKHVVVLAEAARRAAVVGDGDDHRDVFGHVLDAGEARRDARAASDDGDLRHTESAFSPGSGHRRSASPVATFSRYRRQ